MVGQLNLNLAPPDPDRENELGSIRKDLRFVVDAVASILDNLPVQRRPPSDATKDLHVRVTMERRAGFCPCCEEAVVCGAGGKLPGAEFDHWFGRYRNGSAETWLVCGPCNRRLERPAFKTERRSAFEAYQLAVRQFTNRGQPDLFG
jgi:hypothetical protein